MLNKVLKVTDFKEKHPSALEALTGCPRRRGEDLALQAGIEDNGAPCSVGFVFPGHVCAELLISPRPTCGSGIRERWAPVRPGKGCQEQPQQRGLRDPG